MEIFWWIALVLVIWLLPGIGVSTWVKKNSGARAALIARERKARENSIKQSMNMPSEIRALVRWLRNDDPEVILRRALKVLVLSGPLAFWIMRGAIQRWRAQQDRK